MSTDPSQPGPWLRARVRGFGHALRGLWHVLRTQPHAKVHLAATLAVALAGWWLGVSRSDACWLAVAVGLVWAGEAMNTAVERLADAVHPGRHPMIGAAKDAAAAAVLVLAAAAAFIGLCVFGPHLLPPAAG